MAAGASGGRSLWLVNGAIVVVVLLALAGTVIGLTSGSANDTSTLRTTPLGRGTVSETVTASGTVTTALSSTVNFGVSGRIAEVRVRLGDVVEKGETLATLDGEYAEANLDAAEAKRDSARQALDDARTARDNPAATTTSTAAAPGATAAAPGATAAAPGATAAAPGAATPPGTPAQPGATTAPAAGAQPGAPAQPGAGTPPGSTCVGICRFGAPSAKQGPTPTPTPPAGGTGTGATGTTGTTAGGTGGAAGGAGASATTPEGQVASAEATLADAEAGVIQARQATEDLDLLAPQAGTVVSLDGVEGQVVGPQGIVTSSTASGNPAGGRLPDGTAGGGSGAGAAAAGGAAASGASGAGGSGAAASGGGSSSVTAAPSAPAVLTIADLAAMQVKADIPELDVGQVAAGQPVDVRINALPGRTVPGAVAMVNLLPGSGSAVQYGTSVALTAPPLGMRPGMSASVSIITRSVPNVPFLPSAAIRALGGEGATSGTVDVLVGPDNHRESRTIGLGLSSDTVTQVTSGLSDGELVVLPDPNTVDPFQGGGGPPGTQGGDRNRGGSGGGN